MTLTNAVKQMRYRHRLWIERKLDEAIIFSDDDAYLTALNWALTYHLIGKGVL